MVLVRMDGESDLAYHKRLVYGKLIDKTLSDVDFSEIAEAVYGQTYSSDVARRMMYGSCKTLQLVDDAALDDITPVSLINELEDKRIELQKERQRFFDQRREYNKLVNVEGRYEHLEERLVEAANHLDETVGSLFTGMTYDKYPEKFFAASPNDAVLVLTDWHYGLDTHNVWNTYNKEVCTQRVQSVVQQAITKLTLHDCNTLHVVLLGDFVHGAIHNGARVASEELVCDQLMQVCEILAQTIAELAGYVESVVVYSTYGNHARTVQNKNDSVHRDNMERLIPWWLKHRLSESRSVDVRNESDTEIIYLNVLGHGICASHGDLDSVAKSPSLFHTVFNKKFGKDVECVLLGDKHHREEIEELGVSSIIVGSLCGTDDYANGKRLYSTPEQLMLIVNEQSGIDATYHLNATL
jgi:hypothetical protein